MSKVIRSLPLNRVEGDLEIRVEMEGDRVVDAWSAGTLYRGFENIMRGRGPLDGLVITPRVCGICSTSHLSAAAQALDAFYQIRVPANGIRVRNIALGVEHLQSDIRQAMLLFMCDLANQAYSGLPLHSEAVARYASLTGKSAVRTLQETAKLIEIIAVLGGQWPHSSFMVPGGVVSNPEPGEYVHCAVLLKNFRLWYEQQVLGCSLDRWAAVDTREALDVWLEEKEAHREGDLGFYIRYSKLVGLDALGEGCGRFLTFGAFDLPENSGVTGFGNRQQFLPAGFRGGSDRQPFNQKKIREDVTYSWLSGGLSGGKDSLHPSEGVTIPYATGEEANRYTWAKAPRYDGLSAETGPMAQLAVSGHPLITDLLRTGKPSVFVRELARLIRPALLLPVLDVWLRELPRSKGPLFIAYPRREEGEGVGLVEAPRGGLGHWIRIQNNKITAYQIITPTTWNASPRDAAGVWGPMEQALIGTSVKDLSDPIELMHIVRSFDPCLVCTVHAVTPGMPDALSPSWP